MSDLSNQPSFITGFIEIYRQLPSLWNIKSKNYSNRNEKAKGYQKLIDYYKTVDQEANIDKVKKKINNIRSAFRKEHKKVLKSRRSGSASDDIYEPTLWYYNMLLFTASQEEPRATISNEDEFLESDEEGDGQDDNSQDDQSQFSVRSPESELPLQSPTTPQQSLQSDSRTSSRTSTYSSKRKKSQQENAIDRAFNALEKEDEFDVVGANVAHKLRRMDSDQRLYAEFLINTILFKGIQKQLCSESQVYVKPVTNSSHNVCFDYDSTNYKSHPQTFPSAHSATSMYNRVLQTYTPSTYAESGIRNLPTSETEGKRDTTTTIVESLSDLLAFKN